MAAGASAAQVVEARFPAEKRRGSLVLTPIPASAPSPLSPDEARRFRAVVLPHADAAYNLALRLARREDVAEDIVHRAQPLLRLAARTAAEGDRAARATRQRPRR
jgi:hypothetical protein